MSSVRDAGYLQCGTPGKTVQGVNPRSAKDWGERSVASGAVVCANCLGPGSGSGCLPNRSRAPGAHRIILLRLTMRAGTTQVELRSPLPRLKGGVRHGRLPGDWIASFETECPRATSSRAVQ